MPDGYNLPRVLKKLMEKHSYSQQKLADLICTDQASIWNWLSGRKVPTLENAMRVAKVFDVSVDYLIYTEI